MEVHKRIEKYRALVALIKCGCKLSAAAGIVGITERYAQLLLSGNGLKVKDIRREREKYFPLDKLDTALELFELGASIPEICALLDINGEHVVRWILHADVPSSCWLSSPSPDSET